MVVCRENTGDVYTGLEFREGAQEALRLREALEKELGRRSWKILVLVLNRSDALRQNAWSEWPFSMPSLMIGRVLHLSIKETP